MHPPKELCSRSNPHTFLGRSYTRHIHTYAYIRTCLHTIQYTASTQYSVQCLQTTAVHTLLAWLVRAFSCTMQFPPVMRLAGTGKGRTILETSRMPHQFAASRLAHAVHLGSQFTGMSQSRGRPAAEVVLDGFSFPTQPVWRYLPCPIFNIVLRSSIFQSTVRIGSRIAVNIPIFCRAEKEGSRKINQKKKKTSSRDIRIRQDFRISHATDCLH